MKNQIYRVVTGSTAYGLDIKGVSDIDEKGVYLPSVSELLSFKEPEKTITQHGPDVEFHILKKFLELAMKQNPTILEMLYVDKKFILYKHEIFDKVLENRDKFITKNVYHSFSGYASDQLMRIKNSLDKATKEDLEKHAYDVLEGLLESLKEKHPEVYKRNNSLFLNDIVLLDNGKYKVNVDVNVKDVDFVEMFASFNGVNNTIKNFNRRKSRNKKTGEGKLEKHAMHLVRLVIEGIKVLNGEGVSVRLDEHIDLLMSIRKGEMPWNDFFVFADELFVEMDIARDNSKLPERLDEEFIVDLYDDIMKDWIEING